MTGPGPYFDRDLHTSSGLPTGSILNSGRIFGGEGGEEYPRFYFTGPDMDLFWKEIGDNDNDNESYSIVSKMRRPLPMGTYELYNNGQDWVFFPCNYIPGPYLRWYVHVSAPAGTLHEAFFDPVVDTSTSAVGAGGENGVLKPASFTLDGVGATTIERIEWESNSVEMELAPSAQLADHHIDFIALDGSVALRLDFDDATATTTEGGGSALTWGVCRRPWQDGDLLMLRISESSPDLSGATSDTTCVPTPATNLVQTQARTLTLPVPGGFTATPGDGSVTLDWDDSASTTTRYHIAQWDPNRNGNKGAWRLLPLNDGVARFDVTFSSDPSNLSTAVVGGLTNGVSYHHSIQAVNHQDNSQFSDWAPYTYTIPTIHPYSQ